MALEPTPYRTSIQFCINCRGAHEDLEIRPLEPDDPFDPVTSVWYYCPESPDPACLLIADIIIRRVES